MSRASVHVAGSLTSPDPIAVAAPPCRAALALVLAAAAVLGLAAARAAGSEAEDKAQKAFDQIYGADFKSAMASRDTALAVALAGTLLDAAKAAEAQPEMLAVLAARACELGARDPKGYETALAAADLVAEKAPALAGPCQDEIIALRQRQYQTARGDAKAEPGEALVDALAASAATQTAAGDSEEAGRRLQRALGIARAVKSSKAEGLEMQIRVAAAREKAEAQAAALKAKVEADPADAKSRDTLVRLLVVDIDRPSEAAKYLDETLDAVLRKFVPAAAKPVADAPELACLGLAGWYLDLGSGAGLAGKAAMYVRAKAYAARFLELHQAADLDRTRMELAIKKADDEIAKLGPAAKKKLRVVVVTGGSIPIDHAAFMKVFDAPDLDATPAALQAGGETFDNIEGWKYDTIVLYNVHQAMTAKQQQNFLALMDKGVGLVVLHHACLAYEGWPEFTRIIGTTCAVGAKVGIRYKVHLVDPQHPITKGLRDYEITDETFSGLRIDPQNHVLLATAEPSSSKAIGWTRAYRKARVCYLQHGHDQTAYANPAFRTLVHRAIAWTAGRL